MNVIGVAEEKAEYHFGIFKQEVYQEHDKTFRKILDNKTEAVGFIKEALKLKYDIKEKEIEKYNGRFVTGKLKNEEADVIYKLKDRNIFFLIEHQSKVDYTMALRILRYEIDIIRSVMDTNKIGKKNNKLPAVIPIVLYTGKGKWNAKLYVKEMQEKLEGYKMPEYGRYNLVDVNDYTDEELLKKENFISKAMLLEKSRDTSILEENAEKIITEMNQKKNIYGEEQRELLGIIIEKILSKRMDARKIKEMLEKIEEGGDAMLAAEEMVLRENKMLIAKGRREGKIIGIEEGKVNQKREIAKKMLQEEMSIEVISRITELSKEEILKLKNEGKN